MSPFGSSGGFRSQKVIGTPDGDVKCTTDDLKEELQKAAEKKGYAVYRVFINGLEIPDEASLPTNSVAALQHPVKIERYSKVA